MSNPYENAKQKNQSVLGPTLRFKGKLSADEDLLIQGKVEGSIKHSSSLTIGEEGTVKADISAEYVAVEGNVQGDISGSQSIVIRDTAKIDGNIFCPVVTLLEGATFNGSIDMSGKTASDTGSTTNPSSVNAQSGSAGDSKGSHERDESSTAAKKKSQRPEKKSASAA